MKLTAKKQLHWIVCEIIGELKGKKMLSDECGVNRGTNSYCSLDIQGLLQKLV